MGSLSVLEQYPTPELLLDADSDKLAVLIRKASHKGDEYGKKKAKQLYEIAVQASVIGIESPSDQALMRSVITVLRQLLDSAASIGHQIRMLVQQDEYLKDNMALIQSIPGVGVYSAAVLLAEIGNFSLFHKPKQLAAYFGLDPAERQSGTIQSNKNKLSKRGSSYARAILYMIAHNAVHTNRFGGVSNPVLAEFYQKKCQSKPANVAICTVMHKLSNIIFAVLRDRKPFELRLPEEHARKLYLKAA